MRVLALNNENTGAVVALDVHRIEFSDEKNVNGLLFYSNDYTEDWLECIPNVPLQKAIEVCREAVHSGFCDVTALGELECYHDVLENE